MTTTVDSSGGERITRQQVGAWDVVMTWPDNADQLGPSSLAIHPVDGSSDTDLLGGISSTILRHIDFRRAREEWLESRALGQTTPQFQGWHEATYGGDGRGENLRRVLARDGVSPTYLAYLAEAYVGIVRSGERSVSGKLAEMTGRSSDTVKQHLHRARSAGMLTSMPGKAGGQATDKAAELIIADAEESAKTTSIEIRSKST